MNRKYLVALASASTLAFVAACADSSTSPTGLPGKANAQVTVAEGDGSPCEQSGGWTKIDANSGSASGDWGSYSYPKGNVITYNVLAGYTLELCIKSGENVGGGGTGPGSLRITIEGPESGTISTPEGLTQDVSHTSWRITHTPPTVVLQNLSVSKGATASYRRNISWALTKGVNAQSVVPFVALQSVTFSGTPGDAFPVKWQVVADETEGAESHFSITGQITITNPNPVDVNVSVTDVLYNGNVALGTAVQLDCNGAAAGTPSTGTVAANSSLTCDYTASPTGRTATVNRADVAVTGYTPPVGATTTISGGFATAPISWVATINGDDEVTLGDERFEFSELIQTDRTEYFLESIPCPSDLSLYTNGFYTRTVTNVATLNGPNTELTDDASVTINCSAWVGETAVGRGLPWSATKGAPSNWFMYTPWTALSGGQTVDLIAGQHYDIGDITAVRTVSSTSITIALESDGRFANVANNVKIYPMQSCGTNQKYVQPGQFTVKRTALAGQTSITVTGLPNVDCYAIHVDAQRLLMP